MLAEGAGFLEYSDLDVAQLSPGFVVGFDEAGKGDRTGEARRSATNEQHIHRNRFSIRRLCQDQAVERERRLVPPWQHGPVAIGAAGHQWCFLASRTASVSAGITSNTSPTIP